MRRAEALFRGFRLRGPRSVRAMNGDLPPVAIEMGKVRGIAYEMRRGRQTILYWHEFAEGSEPVLGAAPGRAGLVLLGGRYHVTRRGIVDLRASGREAAHASTLDLVEK
jgi:hypothetical protein